MAQILKMFLFQFLRYKLKQSRLGTQEKLTAFSRFTVNCLRILSNAISSVFGWSWIITWPHTHSHTDTTGFSTGSPRWPLAPVSVDCKIETGDWIKTIFQVTHQGYTKMSYEIRISAFRFHDKTPLKYEILNENIARKHHFSHMNQIHTYAHPVLNNDFQGATVWLNV